MVKPSFVNGRSPVNIGIDLVDDPIVFDEQCKERSEEPKGPAAMFPERA